MQCEDLVRFVLGGCSWGKFFVGLGGADLVQGSAIALDWWVGCDLRLCLTRVPRFRLLAPLRGSTPRQFFILSLDFRYLCRSAQNDMEADRYVNNTILIR